MVEILGLVFTFRTAVLLGCQVRLEKSKKL
jgi:hypothetical protein